MGRKKLKDNMALKHIVKTRVNGRTYLELQDIISQTLNMDVSTLVRKILCNQRIKTYTHDKALDPVLAELSAIRNQIKTAGLTINQMTRMFNTYSEPKKKESFAKIALEHYIGLDEKIERALSIITELSKRWLSE